jgi:hypothetical protein
LPRCGPGKLAVLRPRQRRRGQRVADMKKGCETTDVVLYESFWLATAAAAPVIALAAVVALPDTSEVTGDVIPRLVDDWFATPAKVRAAMQAAGAVGTALEVLSKFDYTATGPDYAARRAAAVRAIRPLRVAMAAIRWTAICNVLAQAVVLALSLTALAYNVDVMPRWLAIALVVGGILLLAATVSLVSSYRKATALLPEALQKGMTEQFKELLASEELKEQLEAREYDHGPGASKWWQFLKILGHYAVATRRNPHD